MTLTYRYIEHPSHGTRVLKVSACGTVLFGCIYDAMWLDNQLLTGEHKALIREDFMRACV